MLIVQPLLEPPNMCVQSTNYSPQPLGDFLSVKMLRFPGWRKEALPVPLRHIRQGTSAS